MFSYIFLFTAHTELILNTLKSVGEYYVDVQKVPLYEKLLALCYENGAQKL